LNLYTKELFIETIQDKTYSVFGKQIVAVIIANVIILVIAFFQIPIVTRGLGLELYGIWALIVTAIDLIVPFCLLSFSLGIIRFLAGEKDLIKIKEDFFSAYSTVMITGTVFSLIFFLLSDLISLYIFKNPAASYYIKLSSILILLNSLFPLTLSFFRRESKVGIYNTLNVSLNILIFGLLIIFLFKGYGLEGVVLASIIGTLAVNAIGCFIIIRQVGFHRPRFKNMRAYLKWGIPLTPNSMILWIIQASDRYVISFFLGASSSGIYNAAYGIGSYASFVLWPLGIVLFPKVSKLYNEGNIIECKNYFKYSLKYLMLLTIPAAAGLSMLGKPLLHILTTPEFISGFSVIPLIAFGSVMFCIYQINSYVIFLIGKTHLNIRLLGIGAILNFGLNLILVPHLGITGSGLASFLANTFITTITIIITRKYFAYDPSLIFLSKALLSSGIMSIVIWVIKPESIFMVLLSIIAGIIVYFGILILTRGISRAELDLFSSTVRNNLRTIFHK
jgi:O-antigen/teichoic acid export membrane protein